MTARGRDSLEEAWVSRSPDVLWRDGGGDVVLTRQGRAELDVLPMGSAAEVWRSLETPRRVRDVIDGLARNFGVEATVVAQGIAPLLEDLIGKGYVRMVADAG